MDLLSILFNHRPVSAGGRRSGWKKYTKGQTTWIVICLAYAIKAGYSEKELSSLWKELNTLDVNKTNKKLYIDAAHETLKNMVTYGLTFRKTNKGKF